LLQKDKRKTHLARPWYDDFSRYAPPKNGISFRILAGITPVAFTFFGWIAVMAIPF